MVLGDPPEAEALLPGPAPIEVGHQRNRGFCFGPSAGFSDGDGIADVGVGHPVLDRHERVMSSDSQIARTVPWIARMCERDLGGQPGAGTQFGAARPR